MPDDNAWVDPGAESVGLADQDAPQSAARLGEGRRWCLEGARRIRLHGTGVPCGAMGPNGPGTRMNAEMLVERMRIELTTSALRTRRSPS